MLNFKHLHYFVSVAREGGIIRAAERLHLAPQTLSVQILKRLHPITSDRYFGLDAALLERPQRQRLVIRIIFDKEDLALRHACSLSRKRSLTT